MKMSNTRISGRSKLMPQGSRIAFVLIPFLGCLARLSADTLVSGPISGAWTKENSPYRVVDNCTVADGQWLSIEPGVTVKFAPGLGIIVYGQIAAIGSAAERITFKGAGMPASNWQSIYIQKGGGVSGQGQFQYCNFSDASRAVHLGIFDINATLSVSIGNCTFSNCTQYGIFGEARGRGGVYLYENYFYEPTLQVEVWNSHFARCASGGSLYAHGNDWTLWGTRYQAVGRASANIRNCVFEFTEGTALEFTVGTDPGNSTVQVMNSVISDCARGVVTVDPYNTIIKNCIVQGATSNAVTRVGSLGQLGNNCFYANRSTFVGYPSAYGMIVDQNGNGTPCDAALNIFEDPLFADTRDYTLSPTSPCIDGGDAGAAYRDTHLPPSLGTTLNDLGAYGGPGACGWLTAPIIQDQPGHQSSCLSHGATFLVMAGGAQPLSYQWYFNGTALPGETSTNLSLTNLRTEQAGTYFVVVTNALGSVTSAPARLVVLDAWTEPRLYSGLTIFGQPGLRYVLSCSTDLGNPASWVPIATNTMGSSNWFHLDLDSPLLPRRFYKATLWP
jgi:hypothetical protein